MKAAEMQREALARARNGDSARNEALVISSFLERGIPEADIQPRINVLTYHAWRALGRQVRRGERSVRVETRIPITGTDPDSGERTVTGTRAKTAYVFHVSQTVLIEAVDG